MEDRKCKPGYCGVQVGGSTGFIHPRLERSGLNLRSKCVFIHEGSPGSCCSKWRSSRAVWRPTARCWSPLRLCRPGWGPRWPAASAGCPRSEPGGRRLRGGEGQTNSSRPTFYTNRTGHHGLVFNLWCQNHVSDILSWFCSSVCYLLCRCDMRSEAPRRSRWRKHDGCSAVPPECTAHGRPGWPPEAQVWRKFEVSAEYPLGGSEMSENAPPCHPWPLWPNSWGPAYSSRGGGEGGAEGLRRWWCCAPGAGGQTFGLTRLPPQMQTCLFHLPHGWRQCHTPTHTHTHAAECSSELCARPHAAD